jgi:hypothetical protein
MGSIPAMKLPSLLFTIAFAGFGGHAIAQTARLPGPPTPAEARFVAHPYRCLQFLGDDGAEADNVDASYARELARALRSGPRSLERIRAACEKKSDLAQYRLDLARYRLAK